MITVPFFVELHNALAGNASVDLAYTVASSWILHIDEIFTKSTGAYSITGISDSNGRNYSNATVATPILNTFLQDPTSTARALHRLPLEFVIPGNVTFKISVKDTSGSTNTIDVLLIGKVELPGS